MGENATFVGESNHRHVRMILRSLTSGFTVCFPSYVGGEDFLVSRGVEIVNLDSTECKDLMTRFIQAKPEVWNEDIGEE